MKTLYSCSNSATWRMLALCWFALAAANSTASEFVILGDSFGAYIGDSVRAKLNARGLRSMRIHNAAVPGSSAEQWLRGTHGTMASIFARNTNAMAVLLGLGGNDILSKLPNSQAAAAAVAPTTTNVVRVLAAIASVSSAPILYSSYDYVPGPIRSGGTALEINQWATELVNSVTALVAVNPALKDRVTVLNTLGLLQIHYGIPQLGLPPFDPSLPSTVLPGPATAFADDVHLTRKGYDIKFEKLYADFFAFFLERSTLIARGAGATEVRSAAGLRFEIQATQDFLTWTPIAVLTNTTGVVSFQDAGSPVSTGVRFYRATSMAR